MDGLGRKGSVGQSDIYSGVFGGMQY